MNNAVFGKAMENVRKHRDIKFVTADKIRNQLASEPNYHTTKDFSENLMAVEIKKKKKKKVKINKRSISACQYSILDIIKTSIYEFWYNYNKPKYQNGAKLC